MTDTSAIKEHMDVISADGAHVGTVDHVEGGLIKLTKKDGGHPDVEGGSHVGHHHFLPVGLIAGVEGDTVRLSVSSQNVSGFLEEEKAH